MLLALVLLGCPPAAPPTAPVPPAEAPAPAAEAPAPTEAPPAAPADSACVKSCMDQRMMQAVSIDKIRADCQVECGEAPKPPL